MDDIKIFISTHKENIRVPNNKLLYPIQVGSAIASYRFPKFLHDNDGESDNISDKNASYCELTAQYWVWKNIQADYYGFFHYRRYFSFTNKEFPTTHEPFIFDEVVFPDNSDAHLEEIALQEVAMREEISKYDFITSRKSQNLSVDETVYEQYANSVGQYVEDIDTVIDIIKSDYPDFVPVMEKYLNGKAGYCCNMFIMKKELFDNYCKWLFDILQKHENRRDIKNYPAAYKRVSGYLAERLCGIYITYLYEKGYKGKELQRVYYRDTDITVFPGIDGKDGYLETTHNPKLSFKIVCRGHGQVYTKIKVNKKLRDYKLVAMYKRQTGGAVNISPKLSKKDKKKDIWYLELPAVGEDLYITLKLCDDKGDVYACLNQIVKPKIAGLKSKINKIVNKKTVNTLLQNKADVATGSMFVDIDKVIANLDGKFILQASIKELYDNGKLPIDNYEINVSDSLGNVVPKESIFVISDKCIKKDENIFRRVDFSVELDTLEPNINIRVKGADKQFNLTKEPGMTKYLVEEWKDLTSSASNYLLYNEWFLKRRVSKLRLFIQGKHRFDINPKYSIVVPLYNTPIEFLDDMVQSVLGQSYKNFELILVNASPDNDELNRRINEYVKSDKRIIAKVLEKNLGITENTNEGINVASGDFLCFLDHDDVLEKDILFEYTKRINEKPQTDLLYCDEDKLYNGKYCDPYFKPDYNIDLLRGINYICHFLTVRKSIVDELEMPTKIYDGAQDHHMTFRVAEKARNVAHISKILYHWRIHDNSTASDPEEKPYTQEAARLSVEHHIKRIGLRATAIDSKRVPRHYELEYELPKDTPLVSIVITGINKLQSLKESIDSIFKNTTYTNIELILVINQDTNKECVDYCEELKKTHNNIYIEKCTESANNILEINDGVKRSSGIYILLLNADVKIATAGFLEKMLGISDRSDIGAVGVKILNFDNTINDAGIAITKNGPIFMNRGLLKDSPGYYDAARLSWNVSAVSCKCIMIKKRDFEEIGGFDKNFNETFSEIDFCTKLRKNNLLVLYEPSIEAYKQTEIAYIEDIEETKRITKQQEETFKNKWNDIYKNGDMYFNKNFLQNNPYFKL